MKNPYIIRLCRVDEIEKLQDFIDKYWKKDHILSKSKKLLLFQHKNINDSETINFVIAENTKTCTFDAVFGFILTSIYDSSNTIQSVKWGAIWKVREDVKNQYSNGLGLAVFKYVLDIYPEAPYAVVGMSKYNIAICNALHFTGGALVHYYIANKKLDNFKIAENPFFEYKKNECLSSMKKVVNIETVTLFNSINPFKNTNYFKERYSNHPFFKYQYYGIYNDSILKIILVVRKIELLNTSVLRIVDMIGDFAKVGSIYESIQNILQQEDSEYIDCYNEGIDINKFLSLGFHVVDKGTIIPDYFEPFERKNVELNFAYSSKSPIVIFKGDGDQDRPSFL